MHLHIHKGTRFVLIQANDAQGPFSARLFVNCKDNVIESADATTTSKRNIKTLEQAKKYASTVLS